jgi:hypothetical protein
VWWRKTAKVAAPRTRSRLYDEAVVQALTILWEAADRVCGERLKPAIPALVVAMESGSVAKFSWTMWLWERSVRPVNKLGGETE